jgi:hypothetical protein
MEVQKGGSKRRDHCGSVSAYELPIEIDVISSTRICDRLEPMLALDTAERDVRRCEFRESTQTMSNSPTILGGIERVNRRERVPGERGSHPGTR